MRSMLTKSATGALFLTYGRMHLNMRELADALGLSHTYVSNRAAAPDFPVRTYIEGRQRWADIRDVGEYLDKRRAEVENGCGGGQ